MPELNTLRILRFLKSASGRLSLTYLAIIMLMSIGFSIVFYNTSSRQLGRQLPPQAIYSNDSINAFGPNNIETHRGTIDAFFEQRIAEGRRELLMRLVWLNLLALVGGSVVSYMLARRTLQPIEAAMEAQSRFVSDASHELRTPITALQTTNEVALRKPKLSITEAKDLLQHNVAEAAKLKDLSDSLLVLLKQGNNTVKMTSTSLQDIVGDAMNNVVTPASYKEISINDAVPRIYVIGNKPLVTQLITILLDNAIKYSNAESTIQLEAFTRGNYAYLLVQDHGIGINASDIPYIFDRFYRADRSRSKEQREGYGLGLSIAQKIAEQHHGEILVDSQPGKGSTFTVKLPLARTKTSEQQ